MDPNLEKIRDVHLEDIKKGNVARSIIQARSYLTIMLGEFNPQIDTELKLFMEDLKGIAGSKFRWEDRPQKPYRHRRS